uniref:Solute carrier family 39 member 11 n=1 Tax=Meleagris gallopavo TaxID=9103 RepID=A0A803Y4B4_MELGA
MCCCALWDCSLITDKAENGEPYQRRRGAGTPLPDSPPAFPMARDAALTASSSSWRRILLMILAITIHNIPEGLAVGVGFGAIGKSVSATFQSARQNKKLFVWPLPRENGWGYPGVKRCAVANSFPYSISGEDGQLLSALQGQSKAWLCWAWGRDAACMEYWEKKLLLLLLGSFYEEEKMGTALAGALQEPFVLESSSGVIYI